MWYEFHTIHFTVHSHYPDTLMTGPGLLSQAALTHPSVYISDPVNS